MLNQKVLYNGSCYHSLKCSFVVAARVAEKKQHNLIGYKVEVQLVSTVPASKSLVPQATDTDTILVKGLKECHTESALKFFFTNKKKCGGGDVTKISINKESAYVSFADPKGRFVCMY